MNWAFDVMEWSLNGSQWRLWVIPFVFPFVILAVVWDHLVNRYK